MYNFDHDVGVFNIKCYPFALHVKVMVICILLFIFIRFLKNECGNQENTII